MPRVRRNLHDQRADAGKGPDDIRRDREALMRHYRATFATESGQVVLADLLRKCGVLLPSPNDETEGARKIGLHIIDQITREPVELVQFMLSSETGDLLNERNANH